MCNCCLLSSPYLLCTSSPSAHQLINPPSKYARSRMLTTQGLLFTLVFANPVVPVLQESTLNVTHLPCMASWIWSETFIATKASILQIQGFVLSINTGISRTITCSMTSWAGNIFLVLQYLHLRWLSMQWSFTEWRLLYLSLKRFISCSIGIVTSNPGTGTI